MYITAEIFQSWSNKLPEKPMDRTGKEHNVLVGPAPFCSTWYINDGRYLTRDDVPESVFG